MVLQLLIWPYFLVNLCFLFYSRKGCMEVNVSVNNFRNKRVKGVQVRYNLDDVWRLLKKKYPFFSLQLSNHYTNIKRHRNWIQNDVGETLSTLFIIVDLIFEPCLTLALSRFTIFRYSTKPTSTTVSTKK